MFRNSGIGGLGVCIKMFTILELTVSNGSLKPYKEKQEMKATTRKVFASLY